ncbi:(4Fe-4S)-binding protein [Kitasatospora viridis]|uniref:Putative Fe-S cluster protein YjdI n=1 Tax=Kitasatospora viridis TaxID=281105 RepID=A0A561T7B0_9ACTN|nr:(4Fe-4S)-binding protein [Kitasatospora viridis]TWF82990.1 putative Fe-S cluster protein YjdI [Kitasatospora viridis]
MAVKSYAAQGITVHYDTALCRHAAECVQGLPRVFDTTRRPWIDPAAEPPAAIAEVIRRCPTNALTYDLTDGHPEQPDRPTSIRRTPDGRLLLRGELVVEGPDGERELMRAMLCGCGTSAEQPYCDRSGACGG